MIRKVIELTEESRRKKGNIFVFPGGEKGFLILTMISQRLLYDRVYLVDNYLCKHNNNCLSLNQAISMFSENDLFLVATEKTEIIGELRREKIQNGISEEKSVYLFGECFEIENKDMRLVHLIYSAEEIYKNQICGNVAEAGVFRGEFAKHINALFPDRKMYLFDSFEGFRYNDATETSDNKNQYHEWIHMLKNTSEPIVIDKMPYKENVIIKKGFVPETLYGIEDKFAFVNLDMDLYKPTYDGLVWFWDRLTPGGYIFVHDYGVWDGIKTAVDQFCNEKKVGYFRLADKHSVALVKTM